MEQGSTATGTTQAAAPTSAAAPEPSQERVQITEASTEDLRAFGDAYQRGKVDDEGNYINDSSEGEQEPGADDNEDAGSLDGEVAAGAEEKPDNTKPKTEPKTEQQLEEENIKLRQRIADSQAFIQRQASELGSLRKERVAMLQQVTTALKEDRFADDPVGHAKAISTINTLENDISKIDEHTETLQREVSVQQQVHQWVKPEEFNVDTMARLLKQEGVSEEYLRNFVQNPYRHMSTDGLINLHHRAKAVNAAVYWYQKAQELESKNKELEKAPDQVLDKVDQAARRRPTEATSRSTPKSREISGNVDVTRLSTKELRDLAARLPR